MKSHHSMPPDDIQIGLIQILLILHNFQGSGIGQTPSSDCLVTSPNMASSRSSSSWSWCCRCWNCNWLSWRCRRWLIGNGLYWRHRLQWRYRLHRSHGLRNRLQRRYRLHRWHGLRHRLSWRYWLHRRHCLHWWHWLNRWNGCPNNANCIYWRTWLHDSIGNDRNNARLHLKCLSIWKGQCVWLDNWIGYRCWNVVKLSYDLGSLLKSICDWNTK